MDVAGQAVRDRPTDSDHEDHPRLAPARGIGHDADRLGVRGLGHHDDPEIGEIAQAEVDVGGLERRPATARAPGSTRRGSAASSSTAVEHVGPDVLERCRPARIAQQGDVADAATREIEHDAIGDRVVAGLADQLDRPAQPGRRECDARGSPARGHDVVDEPADGRPDDDDHPLRVRGVDLDVSARSGSAALSRQSRGRHRRRGRCWDR